MIEEQKSYGMSIVHKRLELISKTLNKDFLIEIKDLKNSNNSAAGTQVIIQLPFKKMYI